MSDYWRWIYIEDDIGSVTVTIIATVVRDDDVYVETYTIRIFKNFVILFIVNLFDNLIRIIH